MKATRDEATQCRHKLPAADCPYCLIDFLRSDPCAMVQAATLLRVVGYLYTQIDYLNSRLSDLEDGACRA
jgi:hypothetical protein